MGEDVSFEDYCTKTCGYHSYLPRIMSINTFYIVIGHPSSSTHDALCDNCISPLLKSPDNVAPNGRIVDSIIYQLSYYFAETITDPTFKGYNVKNSNDIIDFKQIGIAGMCKNRLVIPFFYFVNL